MLVGEEPGAVLGTGLLVGGERDHEVPPGPYALPGPAPHHGQDHRVHVLHVDRAAPPDDPVADLPREGVNAPVGGLGRHDVQMTVDEQRVRRRVAALDAGDDVRTALGALQHHGLKARPGQLLGRVLGGGALLAVAAAAVGGVDADEVGGEPDDLVQCLLVSHTAPPRRPRRWW